MSLLGLPRTDRYQIARTWPGRREAAVVHMPAAARPPSWAIHRRTPDGWVRVTGWLSAADYLAWPADDLCCQSDDVIPAVVAGLLDGMGEET